MKIYSIFFIFLFTLFSGFSLAGTVTTVKGQKAVIEYSDDTINIGDEFYAINPDNGKKTAILKVIQTKGFKAVVEIKKGKALKGFELQRKSTASSVAESSDDESSDSEDSSSSRKHDGSSYGYIGAANSNAMSVTISSTTTNLTGTSFGLGAFYDHPFGDSFYFKGMALYEQFKAQGEITIPPGCTGSATCTVDISYLSGYGILRYNLIESKTTLWIGAGFGFQYALSKSATALNTSNISYNTPMVFDIGADLRIGRDGFIPFLFQYATFQDSSTVKGTNSIQIIIGYGWNL